MKVFPDFAQDGLNLGMAGVEEGRLVAEAFGGEAEAAAALGLGKDLTAFRDKNAAARLAFQEGVADELLVGTGHGIGIDDEGLGKNTHGGQLRAHMQFSNGHGALNLLNQLAKNGDIARGRDGKSKRHDCINALIQIECNIIYATLVA